MTIYDITIKVFKTGFRTLFILSVLSILPALFGFSGLLYFFVQALVIFLFFTPVLFFPLCVYYLFLAFVGLIIGEHKST